MIKCKNKNSCKVYSKSGKPLSKPMSKGAAKKRLGQIEYFKHATKRK
jgi:hypothetical protein